MKKRRPRRAAGQLQRRAGAEIQPGEARVGGRASGKESFPC